MNPNKTERFSKGQQIIKEGERGDKAYVINKGYVEVRKETLDGSFIVISSLGPGQIFGEMCLFDNKPRSASVFALSDVEVSVIDKEDFNYFLDDTPPQIRVLVDLLLKRLRQTSNFVALLKLEVNYQGKESKKVEDDLKDLDFPT
jgi:CRP/FNR family transcriptional regulator, cyclic AMP receptor protein